MNSTPVYKVTAETGPDHVKSFEVVTLIAGKPYGAGRGATKKAAEQMAAELTLEMLGTTSGEGRSANAELRSADASSGNEERRMNSRTARAKELYALLGDLPDRDRPISCETMAEEEHPAYRLEKLMLDLNGIERVPAYFVKPKSPAPWPAMLYNHAHGGDYPLGKDELLRGRDVAPAAALRRGTRPPRHLLALH